jgi:hypothetical protein
MLHYISAFYPAAAVEGGAEGVKYILKISLKFAKKKKIKKFY